jgi:peroxiredoxin
MVQTASTMLDLGTVAPDFSLPNTNRSLAQERVALSDFDQSPALLVAFVCNHCPYVIHIREAFTAFAREYRAKGLAVVAISSNDASSHPDDGPLKMAEEAKRHGFSYPYLFDQSQAVAVAYAAACTPDFFLFDRSKKLVYRGQFDGARPGREEIPITGEDLREAVDRLLAGEPQREIQKPSMGCNIKWREGEAPGYFTGERAVE